jgi:phosphopantothenoylcysteine decarboxylase/phosphopantothenate--cysteine ligase
MNGEMWSNPVVAENVKKLEKLGCRVIGPVEGKLACGVEDIGCMSEPEEIVGKAIELLGVRQDLKGRHILITAGGTEEAIDLVRCISNRSSGKMGYALAGKARERGAKVTLISANVNLPSPLDIKPIRVQSTREMLDAVLENYKQADAVVMAAAVADFRPKESARRKIKKNTEHKIELEETEDILMTLAKQKGRDGKIHVGFALETENLIKNAKLKMKNKGLDLIVVNSPSTFGSDSIACSIVDRKGKIEKYNRQKKTEAANMILDKVKELMA